MSKKYRIKFWIIMVVVPILPLLISFIVNFDLICEFNWWEYIFGILFILSGTYPLVVLPLFIIFLWNKED